MSADNMGFSLKLRGANPEEISTGIKRAAEISGVEAKPLTPSRACEIKQFPAYTEYP